MCNLSSRRKSVNTGRTDRGAPAPKRSFDPHKLEGLERRAFEAEVLATPGLKGSRLHLARVLLEEFCWGKCSCYPGDEVLAAKTGMAPSTIGRCLADLAELGVIRIVRRKGSLRRILVILAHPHARAFLSEPGIHSWKSRKKEAAAPAPMPRSEESDPSIRGIQSLDPADSIPQIGESSEAVVVKPASEDHHELAPAPTREGEPDPPGTEGSTSGPNENEKTPEPEAGPAPEWKDWRKYVAEQYGIIPPPTTEGRAHRPAARPALAPTMDAEERAQLIAAALGTIAGDVPGDGPAPEGHRADAAVHEAPNVVDPEAATIEALSKLKPGATRAEVLAATARLTALFNDRKSTGFYRGVCNRVVRGELPAGVLGTAVRAARGPDVIRPGAAFTACIKRCEAVGDARLRERRRSP